MSGKLQAKLFMFAKMLALAPEWFTKELILTSNK